MKSKRAEKVQPMKPDEKEILAKIRTLLALERNYLAEERTALAEFRTGLSIAVVSPTISITIAYLFSLLPQEPPYLLDILNVAFFTILTIVGIWISYRSGKKLNQVRKKKKLLKKRQQEIMAQSPSTQDFLNDYIL